jgi:hypothetical protein
MLGQKTKGKRQKAKMRRAPNLLLPFAFCPLPFAFSSLAL